jgi:peptidase E
VVKDDIAAGLSVLGIAAGAVVALIGALALLLAP